MLERCYNFFKKFCDDNSYEELEMDKDSLYLAVGRKFWERCSPWKARRVECDASERLHRHFHCLRNGQFLSKNVLQQTQETQ